MVSKIYLFCLRYCSNLKRLVNKRISTARLAEIQTAGYYVKMNVVFRQTQPSRHSN